MSMRTREEREASLLPVFIFSMLVCGIGMMIAKSLVDMMGIPG